MCAKNKNLLSIIVADDDSDDREMIREAMAESKILNQVVFVEDGVELLKYLHRKDKYADREKFPVPGVILLDLNMPKKDGRESLREIKAHPDFRRIPVIILTTSKSEEDILKMYNLGVNCFITKPVTFEALMNVIKTLGKYWFEISELPPTYSLP